MRLRGTLLLLLPLTALGCGEAGEPVTVGSSPAEEQRYTASATVLESRADGPQLCLGGVAESYPPQCGGPEIAGWDWDDVGGEESADGTTWGEYRVVGTWVCERLTLTEPAGPPAPSEEIEVDVSTPCPAPPGGWTVVDPSTTTDMAQNDALEQARAEPEFAGAFVDQSINPASQDDDPEEMAMNDPEKLVLNLRFTGDLERHEADARSIWGGALCVSLAPRSLQELETIQQDVQERYEPLGSYRNGERGVVEISVVVAEPELQASLDERYGEDTVAVTGALEPVG